MLMSFNQPQAAFDTAVNRVIDVAIGTAASLVVCALSPVPPAPRGAALRACSIRRHWRFGAAAMATELRRWLPGNGPLLLHACRGGLTVMLLPALAEWIAPVSPVTMGVTAVIVMSIPTTAIIHSDTRAIIQRAAHR